MEELKTGDILLFNPGKNSNFLFNILDWGIRYFTSSEFTHVAMVLKDPQFINKNLKGTYIWESSWEGKPDPQDGKVKLGVQITPIHEFLKSYKGEIYVRKLQKGGDKITDEKLKSIHDVVYDKPYDIVPMDWIGAISRKDSDPQKTNRFWCSALVSYFMVRLSFLPEDLDWSIVRPSDLSSQSDYCKWCNCEYSRDILVFSK